MLSMQRAFRRPRAEGTAPLRAQSNVPRVCSKGAARFRLLLPALGCATDAPPARPDRARPVPLSFAAVASRRPRAAARAPPEMREEAVLSPDPRAFPRLHPGARSERGAALRGSV